MIVIFIASFFCVLNVTLWITFFLKFKRIFSTDDIIASTREEMDRMIADINHNAGRNIELIEDRIKQLKVIVAEADRHIELSKKELEAQKASLSYQQKIDSALQSRKQPYQSFASGNSGRAAQQYMRNQGNAVHAGISDGIQGSRRYELTDEGNRHVNQLQGDLFDQAETENSRGIVSDAGTTFTVESDGSSYASVPVIGGNVTYAEEPIQPQRKLSELVHDLYLAGHSVEEIAREVNRSTTEIQLALEMDMGL
ncbi:MAG: hypothetical protein IJM48_08065 [Treponema sp.]|nr:hypothetical protein [Treponema sp.]